MNRRAAALNDQTRLKTMLGTMDARLKEITAASGDMRTARETLEQAVTEAGTRLKEETAEQNRLAETLRETREQLEAADAALTEAREQYDRKLAEMRNMDARQKLLDEMSRELEGYAHPVRAVVRYARDRGNSKVHGPLSQLISVPREYETAMDMALGTRSRTW